MFHEKPKQIENERLILSEDNEEEDTDNESEIVELNNVKQRKTGKVAFGLQS